MHGRFLAALTILQGLTMSLFTHTLYLASGLVPSKLTSIKLWSSSATNSEAVFLIFIQLKWTCPLLRPDKLTSSDPPRPSALPWDLVILLSIARCCQWPGKLKPRKDKTWVWTASNFIPRLQTLPTRSSCVIWPCVCRVPKNF